MTEEELTWNEEYRITSLDEVKGNASAIQEIRVFLKVKKAINILLVGAPGTGKTSVARIIARKYLGITGMDDALSMFEGEEGTINEFNASDDRGIDFIRDDVKGIVESEGKNVIILDEGEYLTKPTKDNLPSGMAQPALRRLAEKGNKLGKIMIICCNDIDNIIPAILSRFKVIRFSRLSDKDVLSRLMFIFDDKGVKYDSDMQKKFLGRIVIDAQGDMRQATLNAECMVVDGELVVNEGYLLYRESVDTYRNILSKVIDKGDYMGVKKDLVALMYEQQFGMLASQMIGVTDQWIEDKYKENSISNVKYLKFRMALKECDDSVHRHHTRKYVQILGMMAEMRLINLVPEEV